MGKRQPKAPDPAETAAAQGAWNSFTAQQQQVLNQTNQVSPWGTLEYKQTGETTIIDPNGKPIKVPTSTAYTTLSPQQQAIYDQTQAAELNLANTANQQTQKLGDLLADPFQYTNRDAENWAYDLASARILPQQQKNESALRTQLINSGIRPGTAAWDSEMSRLTNANTDQLNQLALTGRQQGFNEQLAMRNQQFNEPISLMSGTQIQNPNTTFAQTPQSQIAGVDYAGIVNSNYQNQMSQYNAKMGALGGLFGGLASTIKWSDARLKTNIEKIGETNAGQSIYSYNYVWGGPVEVGVMAHESPLDAVIVDGSGFLKVNYSRIR